MDVIKIVGKAVLALLALLVVFVGGYACYMQAHFYRIPDHQKLEVENNQSRLLETDKKYTATTYNVGFGAYNQHLSLIHI